MQTTGNLGLKKPEGTDIVDIADLNGNMDILDNAVNGKVDKVTGKQLSTNDYTAAEKTKLAGIATGATNYTHPATHPPAIIAQDASNRFVTDTEKTAWNAKETPAGAQAKADAAVAAAKADYIRQPGYAATSGTAAAYIVVLTPAPTTTPDGFGITIVPHVTNGANPTLSVNGLTAAPLKDQKGVAYAAGKLIAGKPYAFRRVGTDFLADSAGGSGNAVAGDIRAGKTAATDAGDITGTLQVQTGGTVTPGATAVVKPAGIYDTAITVTAVPVPANKVLAGTTIAGTNGTMPDRTRGAAGGYTTAVSVKGDWSGSLVMEPPAGYYESGKNADGFGTVLATDSNYVPSSILSGRSIFGVPGSVPVITSGEDPATGIGIWGDGGLAVYPREGYRKGGSGAGEIKVPLSMLRTAVPLYPEYIKAGVNMFNVIGTLQPSTASAVSLVLKGQQGDGTAVMATIPAGATFASMCGSFRFYTYSQSNNANRVIVYLQNQWGQRISLGGVYGGSNTYEYAGFYFDRNQRKLITIQTNSGGGNAYGNGEKGGWSFSYAEDGMLQMGAYGVFPAEFNAAGELNIIGTITGAYGAGYAGAMANGYMIYY
ncbi:hypothetical protein BK121_28855 [Paenibacillus odorifer]|uniref:hypothetical protein n=1 Tax=Paenibacillus odorifer TaxID=189426 RepID=UPI00096F7F21|nr:hypothetical protein [Paenibacillus odorifer]OMC63167.1 hypothetical protein BK121_28855 [Paenibacillus odorifer]